jgi:replicative DNA helicase
VAVANDLGVPPEYPQQQPEFERQPPQDVAAEQAVLGGMLLSKDAIADVVEVLRSGDFYRPAHQTIYETMLDLYGRGEPADPVTVSAELTRLGQLMRVGGAPYLHTLMSSVPTAANAGYYAAIVAERAVLRRLIEAGTRIVQLGYGAASGSGGDVDDVVDRAQAAVYEVTENRTSEDYVRLEQLLTETMDEIDLISSRGGVSTGVPTGFADLDGLTNGLHPGQMIIIAARPALGKALALDTPLPTPTGWTTMGEVAVGDLLLGADGRPTRVVAATEVMAGRPCYEVAFSDGTVVVADAEHQWITETRASRRSAQQAATGYNRYRHQRTFAAVRTTEEIRATLRCNVTDARRNHCVPNASPLDLPGRDLPLPPYVLGVWLGGGHSASARFSTADPEVVAYLEEDGLRVVPHGRIRYGLQLPAGPPVDAILGSLGVLGNKHVPAGYLRATEAQRRSLLAGLLDTDGTVTRTGSVRFSVTNRRLATDVRELIVGLGHRCGMSEKQVNGRRQASSTAWTLTFTPSEDVFRLERKRLAHKERSSTRAYRRVNSRFINDVRPVPSVPVRCVQVDNDGGLYLASRSMIPTHNSTLALDLARAASIRGGESSVIFSLEMSRTEITMRLLSAEAKVPLHHMRSGRMSDEDWARLARRMGEVAEAPLYIDDSPNLTLMEIRAKARRLKQRHNLKLVVVDYLQLMSSPRRVESRQQEVSEFSRALKLLAKELEVPVVALSQLNRGPEQRTDKKPLLSDLRESGCMTEDTTLLRADTGAPVTLRELIDRGHEGVLVWSLDEQRRLVAAQVTNVFASGVKPVYRLRLASGREVKATGNHPFLGFGGWQSLETLAVDDRIAIPRRTPEPLAAGLGWTEHRLGLLAHLLGDGCVLRTQPVHYTSADEANLRFVEAAAAEFGISPRRVQQRNWWHVYLPAPYRCARGRYNPLHVWFRDLGIEDLRSYQKRIPDILHSASNAEIAVFLRHLWATDGNVTVAGPGATAAHKVYYATSSKALADGVVLLLSRFGIIARTRAVLKAGHERLSYHVIVADGPSLRVFCAEIGVHGRRGEIAESLREVLAGRTANTNVDTLPPQAWDLVRAERYRAGLTERQFQAAIGTNYCGSALYKRGVSRSRLLRCADALDSEPLRAMASDDVFWDRIVAIEPLGEQAVYDATIKGTHNFIADGIVAHNSLEQDADMVILLHREDAYERESPRAGEADLILAKNRNGPTGTVTVAFQGHYSRFVDMQQGG